MSKLLKLDNTKRRIVGSWLVCGCVLVFLMVVVGGVTRLSGSGLSMVSWKPITGFIPPMAEADWQQLFSDYKKSPQFQKVNYDFILADFKTIFWWEYIHRLLGRFIGLVFLVPFLFFLAKKWLSQDLMKKCCVMFVLGAFQGLLGWYMVKSGLVDNPEVSHYRLAAHLLTATILFGYILWVFLDVSLGKPKGPSRSNGIIKLSRVLLLIVLVQIIYGAFVAGLKAGLVYNTFPKMGEYWIAEGVTSMNPFWINFVENLAGVQFVHRYLAYLIVLFVFVLFWRSRSCSLKIDQKITITSLLVIVLFQFLLGVLTLLNAAPMSLSIFHQMFALLLFGNVVILNHRFVSK